MEIAGITFERLEDVAPALKGLNENTYNYLRSYLPGTKTNRLSVDAPIGGRVRVYLTRFPNARIEKIGDLNDVYDEATEMEFAIRNMNKQKNTPDPKKVSNFEYEVGEEPHIIALARKELGEIKKKEQGISPKEETDSYKDSPDMLINTGYTQVISDKPLVVPKEEPVKEMEKVEEKIVETPIPKIAEPVVTESPKIVPSKTLTLNNKDKKQSGVADAIIISVIVIVYIAIIVNLILRLK